MESEELVEGVEYEPSEDGSEVACQFTEKIRS